MIRPTAHLFACASLALIASWTWAAEPAPPLMRPPSKMAFVPTGMEFTVATSYSFGMDDSGALYGMKGNFLSCWPAGATTDDKSKFLYNMEVPNKPIGIYWVGMSADHKHALFGRVNEGALTLGKVRCDTAQPEVLSLTYLDEPLLATYVHPGAEEGRRLSATPSGAPCIPLGDVLKCFGPDKSVVRSLAIADIKPLLDVNPEWALGMVSKPPPTYTTIVPASEVWHFNSFTFLPDGRLFAIVNLEVTRQYPGALPGVAQWLVEQSPEGKIRVRSRAMLRSRECASDVGNVAQISPLLGVNELHYDAEHKMLMAWPVVSWDLKANDQQATSKQDDGSPSLGFRTYPVDGELESGYLSLSKTYNAWFNRKARVPHVYARPGSAMLLDMGVGPLEPNNFLGNSKLFDIKVDMDATDLDLDGLTTAEEKAAGTSPWLPDSDGGGNGDREELIAGTKPMEPQDDDTRQYDRHRMAYSISSLIRLRVGDGATPPDPGDIWGSVQTSGGRLDEAPFCAGGLCRASSGEIVAHYPKTLAVGDRPQSADGSMILLNDGTHYLAQHIPEGTSQPLATVTDVAQVLGAGVGFPAFFAANRREVYVLPAEGRRILLIGDGPPRVVFDLDGVRCASGMGCPADSGFTEGRYTLHILGYDAKIGRLLVTVKEHENNLGRAWIMGVHPTLPPVLMSGIHELWGATGIDFAHTFTDCGAPTIWGMGVPSWALDTGRGDLLTDYGRRDAYLHQLPADLDMYADPVQRVWGDTLVQTGENKLYEVVQIPEAAEPGELLMFTEDSAAVGSEKSTLWHIPPRGGKAEVFRLPKIRVSGMNVAPDGRVCIAAPVPGVFLQVRAHALTFGLPNHQLSELHVGHVVDCDYGPDGRPHLLMTDPPRVLIWNGGDDTSDPDDMQKQFETVPLDEAKVPFQLLVDKDGKDRVLYNGGPLLGMGKMQDGSVVEVDAASQRLRIHGELVGPDLSKWINDLGLHFAGQMQFMLAPVSWLALRVHVAQRPDGLVAVMPYTPPGNVYVDAGTSPPTTALFFDPRTGKTGELTPLLMRMMAGTHALAVLPGGSAKDPWTGEPVPGEPAGGGGGADAGGGGSVSPGDVSSGGGQADGGCTAGGRQVGPGVMTLLALVWGMLWIKRRGHQPKL